MDSTACAIVINYNGGTKLRDCVASILTQSVAVDDLLVVDNASTDGSLELLRELQDSRLRILRRRHNDGLSVARNEGLRAVSADNVLMCDNDLLLAPDCLELMLTEARRSRAALVCPRIVFHPERNVIQADGADNHFLGVMSLRNAGARFDRAPIRSQPVEGAIGACLLLNRADVVTAGGFCELYFFYFEDLEFSLRLASRGLGIQCQPQAVVFHDRAEGTPLLSYRGIGGYPLRRARLTMQNRWLTMALHFQRRSLLVLAPALLAYEVMQLAFALHRGWVGEWWRSVQWMIVERRQIGDLRRSNSQHRQRGDGLILQGNAIPFAEGLFGNRVVATLAAAFSSAMRAYWWLVRGMLDRSDRTDRQTG